MPARTEERRPETTDAWRIRERSDDVQLALLLTYITIGWMTIEGAASLLLGWASKSLLLEAFGIDSVIELFSTAAMLCGFPMQMMGHTPQNTANPIANMPAGWTVT